MSRYNLFLYHFKIFYHYIVLFFRLRVYDEGSDRRGSFGAGGGGDSASPRGEHPPHPPRAGDSGLLPVEQGSGVRSHAGQLPRGRVGPPGD